MRSVVWKLLEREVSFTALPTTGEVTKTSRCESSNRVLLLTPYSNLVPALIGLTKSAWNVKALEELPPMLSCKRGLSGVVPPPAP